MAINFPTSLDNFTNPSSGNTLDSPSHSLQHSDINDAVEAMQRKVGVGTAVAGSASAGQVLTISAAGTSTWSTPTPAGLVLISTTSFTGVSTQSINSVFTSTYDNYYIEIDFTVPTTGGDTGFRLRSSGTDKTTNYAMKGSFLNAGNTPGDYGSGTTTLIYIANTTATNLHLTKISVSRPAISGQTAFMSDTVGSNDNRFVVSARQTETTTFDGFTFYNVGSNNMTGKIKVFGVSQ